MPNAHVLGSVRAGPSRRATTRSRTSPPEAYQTGEPKAGEREATGEGNEGRTSPDVRFGVVGRRGRYGAAEAWV